MAFIDGTAVNVSLPVMQRDFGAAVSGLQWVVEAYALMLASLVVVGGGLADRLGVRRMFAIGIVWFAVASVGCGMAPTLALLIAARVAQGAGAALLIPGSLALLSHAYPAAERGTAIGKWSAFAAMNVAMGPVLGGWLVDQVSWRAVFFINVPMGALVLLLLWRRVAPVAARGGIRDLDWAGALLLVLGFGGLIFGLIEQGNLGWTHPAIWSSLLLFLVAAPLFIWVERRVASPMLPLQLFRIRTFRGANGITLLLYAAMGGAMFFLPLNLIQVQGFTATRAGLAILPLILILSVLSRWSGGLIDRVPPRLPLTLGPLLTAAGYLLYLRTGIGDSYWTTFFPAIVVQGLGMALSVAPLTTVALNAVPERHAGIASGINNGVSRTASLLAIAVLGVVALLVFEPGLAMQLEALSLPDALRGQVLAQANRLAAIDLPPGATPAQAEAIGQAIKEAFVRSYHVVMGLAALSAALAALMAWVTLRVPPGREPDLTG
jgi:EmrB/QacA subfamily drug resistance transporter